MGSEKPEVKGAPQGGAQARENPWINIGFNILIPVLLLTKGERYIGSPAQVLVLALAFPAAYFGYDLWKRRKVNFISIIGFVSILLTGGVGLLELPRRWFIVKETAVPALIGLAVLGSLKTRFPLIRALVFNPQIFRVDAIHARLDERGNHPQFERLLRQSTVILAASFFLSAVLNFVLASAIVKTEPAVDAAQFNAEVGAMTGWSWVVITVPSMAFMIYIMIRLARGIHALTGLTIEEALHDGK